MDTANYKQSSEDYLRIEQAILYLENHYKTRPKQPATPIPWRLACNSDTTSVRCCAAASLRSFSQ